MGDVGSGYLGFMVAAFAIRATSAVPELGWSWLILSGVFVVDATVTLFRRLIRRDRVFTAHRTHAYQHLATAWRSHSVVTIFVLAINVWWLAPIASVAAVGGVNGTIGLTAAYLPLLVGAFWLGAGRPSRGNRRPLRG